MVVEGCMFSCCWLLRAAQRSDTLTPPHTRCSEAVRWLGRRAEALGVDVFPGFAGARVAYGPAGDVRGVQVRVQTGGNAARCSCRHWGLTAFMRACSPPMLSLFLPPQPNRPTTWAWARMGSAKRTSKSAWPSQVARAGCCPLCCPRPACSATEALACPASKPLVLLPGPLQRAPRSSPRAAAAR